MADVELVAITCPAQGCHTMMWIAKRMDKRLRETHESFNCLFGHSASYPKPKPAPTPPPPPPAPKPPVMGRWKCDVCGREAKKESPVSKHWRQVAVHKGRVHKGGGAA